MDDEDLLAPPPPLTDTPEGEADPMPGFGMPQEAEPLPTFGEPEPMDMGAMGMGMDSIPPMGGGLGGEFAAPEMTPLANWRIAQQEKLDAKAKQAEEALAARLAEAKSELDAFYANLADKSQKRAAANREAALQYEQERDAAMLADSWESVGKLVDLKADTSATSKKGEALVEKDTSRMRGLLVQLKHG